jgi:hypothetical protein
MSVAAAGCTKANKSAAPAPTPATVEGMAMIIKANTWSGDFRPQAQRSALLTPPSTNQVFGRVLIVPLRDDTLRSRVQLDISTTLQAGNSFEWSVYPGRCGSGSGLVAPVVPPGAMPRLDVSQSGRAHADSEVALHIPRSGVYHLNVFWNSATPDLSGVMACANLISGG